jgi:hypothetical protein
MEPASSSMTDGRILTNDRAPDAPMIIVATKFNTNSTKQKRNV